jgi:hypothetical protein
MSFSPETTIWSKASRSKDAAQSSAPSHEAIEYDHDEGGPRWKDTFWESDMRVGDFVKITSGKTNLRSRRAVKVSPDSTTQKNAPTPAEHSRFNVISQHTTMAPTLTKMTSNPNPG